MNVNNLFLEKESEIVVKVITAMCDEGRKGQPTSVDAISWAGVA